MFKPNQKPFTTKHKNHVGQHTQNIQNIHKNQRININSTQQMNTTNYVETHHKPCRTAPQSESKQPQKHHTEAETAPTKQTENSRFNSENFFPNSY